ncbi:flagellar filament capping protein FliD [Blastococcus sp. HT6-30]|uniref:flagellar filament capping protein FliD n=1 Tax=Blastococcus sp. HT6-30 TaxID=3144843 RepID=UPI00321A6CF9
MAGMSVDGLASGLDTTSLINALIKAEGAPQTALQTRLSATEAAAAGYRSLNTKFDALRAAAETVLKPATWSSAKATSTAAGVAVALGVAPQPGSLTFSVESVAASHSVVSNGTAWTNTKDPAGFTELTVYQADNVTPAVDADGKPKVISVGGTGTLADAVSAINASNYGLSATAVQVAPGKYQLQVTATSSGAETKFGLGSAFTEITTGTDAALKVGTTASAYTVTSPTNTFEGLMPGATITVNKAEKGVPVTVNVASDPGAVADKVQALVDAANAALASIKVATNPTGGPAATLKGDSSLGRLAGQVLGAVSYGVGTHGSPAAAGLELARNGGSIEFDREKFLTALADDPALVQSLFVGTPTGPGPDKVADTADDGAPGAVQRLMDLAQLATDTTTGTLTTLAKSRDSQADDIQDSIDAWDRRLELRRATLTRQFTAMETALSSMQQQSNWLAGQLSSLPTSS